MTLKLAWQQLLAQWRTGDLRILLIALIVAVSAITAVSFFTNRIASHLSREGALVLGGDVVMIADHPIPATALQSATALGLKHTGTTEFPSMAIVGEQNQLVDIKALEPGFPLRGNLTVQFAPGQPAKVLQATPKIGEVWIEPRLVDLLKINIGSQLELGAANFKVTGILVNEPSRGGDMFNFAPRVMMNAADLEKTKLIQYGSRIKYQLLVAGNAKQVQQFSTQLSENLQRGERVQDLKSARPEIRSALDKADIFLSLAAVVTMILSVAAMLLASGPYVARNMETAALLRCFGASRKLISQLLWWQSALIAFIGGSVGCVAGYLLQYGLSALAGNLFAEYLPAPNLQPLLLGFSVSFSVLFALMWPNIVEIKNSSVVHILRRELETSVSRNWLKLMPVVIVIASFIFWMAQSAKLALAVIAGMLTIFVLCAVLAYFLSNVLYRVSQNANVLNQPRFHTLKIGFANLKRNRALTIAQVIGFSLSAMVLILLMIIKNDLLNAWQASLPADAPNRFMINIQPDQAQQVRDFTQRLNITEAQVFPMIRGRLLAINGNAVMPETYEDERAKRLASREFNLSMASQMQTDNRLLQGAWWQAEDAGKPWISMEQDIANALNIKLGDTLNYDIAGAQIALQVKSIRKVEWDSMRANFFAVTPEQTLAQFPMSYMTAFYLPISQENQLNRFLQQFPNVTVIDVASLMQQIRGIMQKMSLAVAYVFLLCVVAGLVVLYAALVATRDARIRESSLMRVFGASRWEVSIAMLAEFLGIAILASVVALVIANGVAFYVSHFLFEIPYTFNVMISLSALIISLLLIPISAWLVVRNYLNQPPKQLLNSI